MPGISSQQSQRKGGRKIKKSGSYGTGGEFQRVLRRGRFAFTAAGAAAASGRGRAVAQKTKKLQKNSQELAPSGRW